MQPFFADSLCEASRRADRGPVGDVPLRGPLLLELGPHTGRVSIAQSDDAEVGPGGATGGPTV
jgi:hypothetical protein